MPYCHQIPAVNIIFSVIKHYKHEYVVILTNNCNPEIDDIHVGGGRKTLGLMITWKNNHHGSQISHRKKSRLAGSENNTKWTRATKIV